VSRVLETGAVAAPQTRADRGTALGAEPRLVIEHLSYRYDLASAGREFVALCDVSLHVAAGEFVCLVGPSGCGKTTLLHVVAGLLPYDEGRLRVGGADVRGPGATRSVVFQQPNLLPWRSVLGNVRYGMELQRRLPRARIDERARELVTRVGLTGFEARYPAQLSGGMQQRVNLARALATDPELLLMDEPFAALDAQTRELMQAELLKIRERAGPTVLFVTHQIDEAVFLGDRVIVMASRPGRIQAELAVPFERPRALALKRSPAFVALCDQVWAGIEAQAKVAARVATEGPAE
jgi:NitT/TauT family transport system ATP-binding protein